MALAREYDSQSCSIASALEIVGERWTLLILRDAIIGVRKFSDLQRHLGIPRAVLSSRLRMLVDEGLLATEGAAGQHNEYVITAKGLELSPALAMLSAWGDRHYAPEGARRRVVHIGCGGEANRDPMCTICGEHLETSKLEMLPGPGLRPPADDDDPVTKALASAHPLLQPIR